LGFEHGEWHFLLMLELLADAVGNEADRRSKGCVERQNGLACLTNVHLLPPRRVSIP
jgi:hypothetical protein